MFGVLVLIALTFCSPQDPLAQVAPLRTRHYDLVLDMGEARLEDTTKLVEAAWSGFARELGGKPRSKGSQRPQVRFFKSKADWLAGMQAHQEFPLPGVRFVHYSTERDTLYLHDERDTYHARKMMLYGLFLQFHYQLKAKNERLGKEWFITGMADALSTHRWDGKRLELGARLLLATNNRSRIATLRGLHDRLDDGALSVDDMSDWDVRWALTAYLLFGEDGKYRKVFQKRALGKSGSMLMGHDFMAGIGDAEEITRGLDAWVKERGRVLEPVSGLWEENGGELQGEVRRNTAVALALCAPGSRSVQVAVRSTQAAGTGVILDWVDRDHFTIAVLRDYVLRVWEFSRDGDGEVLVQEVPEARRRPLELRVELVGDEVLLLERKRELARFHSQGQRIGLAVHERRGVFEALHFE